MTYSNNDLFPGQTGGMNGLTPWGDPEAYASAATSSAMEPIISPYLQKVFTGQIAQQGLEQLSGNYDPNRTFAQNVTDPKALEQAQNVALSFGPGMVSGIRGAGQLGERGPGSISYLNHAEAMESGAFPWMRPHTPDEIFDATGWYRGPEVDRLGRPAGKWRFILPDEGMSLNPNELHTYDSTPLTPGGATDVMHMVPPGKDLTLGDIVNHDDLYQVHPWLKDVGIVPMPFDEMLGSRGGTDAFGRIMLSPATESDMLSTLSHEIQHLVQFKEGFARGGTVSEFLPHNFDSGYAAALQNGNNAAQAIADSGFNANTVAQAHGFHPYEAADKSLLPQVKGLDPTLRDNFQQATEAVRRHEDLAQQAWDNYFKLGGESEARFTQAGLETRTWNQPPWRMPEFQADILTGGQLIPAVPFDQQIIKY